MIEVLKRKYTVFNGVLPIKSIADKDNKHASIDKLVRMCCESLSISYLTRLKLFHCYNE